MSALAAIDSGRDRRSQLALPLRFALRELRGGLRGFYVFIACIALGVMAIAGVGAVASGLADGLAREGRTILGGDLSFSLSLREADNGRACVHRAPRPDVACRHHAGDGAHAGRAHRAHRGEGGRCRLSALRHGRARSAAAAGGCARAARRRLRRRRRSGTARAARPQAGRPHHGRRGADRNSRGADLRTRQARGRHRLWPAPADQRGRRCARPGSCSPAAWCAGTIVCGFPMAPRTIKP